MDGGLRVVAPAALAVVDSTAAARIVKVLRSREPVRDWTLGFVTGHRVRVIVCMTATICFLYWLQDFMWPDADRPVSLLDQIWSLGSILWLGALIPGTVGLLGMLAYRHPTELDTATPIPQLVCWRIVTSGKNIAIVLDTIRRCLAEME